MAHGTLIVGPDSIRGNVATLAVSVSFELLKNPAKRGEKSPDFYVRSLAPVRGRDLGIAYLYEIQSGASAGQDKYRLFLDDESFSGPLSVTAYPTGEVTEQGALIFEVVWRRSEASADPKVGGDTAEKDDALPF